MTKPPNPQPKKTANLTVNPARAKPEELPRQLRLFQSFTLNPAAGDCRRVARLLKEWQESGAYLHFAPTWEAFLAECIKQPPEWIQLMIQAAEALDSAIAE